MYQAVFDVVAMHVCLYTPKDLYANCWLQDGCGCSEDRLMTKGVMGQQSNCKTLTGVHSTIHLMDPN